LFFYSYLCTQSYKSHLLTHKTSIMMKHLVLAIVAAATLCTTTAVAQNKVRNLSTSTNKLNVELLQNADQTVQVSRYFFAGYNTLCLPMTVSAEQLQKAAPGITVERLAAIQQEGSDLCLLFVDCTDEGIQAGVPYLVNSPRHMTMFVRNTEAMGVSTDMHTIRISDEAGNQVAFSSSYESMAREGRYGIPAQQNVTPLESVLIRTEADKTFLPTRCGFAWEQQSPTANNLLIKHVAASEVTAIQGVKVENGAGAVYDLNGHKVTSSHKGIVIENGRKVNK